MIRSATSGSQARPRARRCPTGGRNSTEDEPAEAGSENKEPRKIFAENLPGGAERDRTADLVIANDALSQLSYGPVPGRSPGEKLTRRPAERAL